MTNSNNKETFTEGTRVLIHGKNLGQILEVINPNSFRVTFWEHGSTGKSEGLFSSDELIVATDFPPLKE